MNIVYFLTYGYSLETWNESSALEREVKYFNSLSKNLGYKFFIITYGDESDLQYSDLFLCSEIIPLYKYKKHFNNKLLNFFNSLTFPRKIKNIINEDVHITKQNQLLGSWVSFIFKKITGSKFFIRTGYDMYFFSKAENKSYVKQKLYMMLTFFGLNSADLYSVTSRSDYDFLLKSFSFKRKKLKILRNWVETSKSITTESRDEKLISIGRLEYQKNYEFLVKELSGKDISLTIYGSGSKEEKLLELSKNLNVNLEIINSISNSDLIKNLQNVKYFILSSHYEGNPKALLEAMSVGCIVFASNIKNHSEIIDHRVNGFLFDLKKGSLIDELNQVINNSKINKGELEFISNNAIETINKYYSISKIFNEEKNILNDLVNNGR